MAFSERFRWAWLVCLLLLAGFLANSISSYLVSKRNVRQTISESALPLTSDNVYSEIQRDLLRPVFISSVMANDTFLRDWVLQGEKDEALITKYLHEIKDEYGTVTSFFVSDKTQTYYHADGVLKTVSSEEPRDEWYFRVRSMADPYEINVDPDMANLDEMTIFINYRVFDYNGRFIGATGVGLTVDAVNRLINSYETRYTRQIYFADQDGKIVLMPSNSPLLGYQSLGAIPGLEKHVSRILSGSVEKLKYVREGKTRFLNVRYVPELSWFLMVEQREDIMLAPLRKTLWMNIGLALTITLIVAWICLIAIKRNQRSLEKQNRELSDALQLNREQKKELESTALNLREVNEKLSAINQEKDEILGLVAHDLRNPLNAILGLCEVAGDDAGKLDQREFVGDIKESANRMNKLIRTLLDVSFIEAFEGKVNRNRVAINPVIEGRIGVYQEQANRKRIRLESELKTTENLKIFTKEDWLEVCIDNILSNAIKYTPEFGSISVTTSIRNEWVTVSVTDSGPGIHDDEKDLLFRKFGRLSHKPTGGESSTGLGLYLVKKMCDRLGVQIEIESDVGEGATFHLRHPVTQEEG